MPQVISREKSKIYQLEKATGTGRRKRVANEATQVSGEEIDQQFKKLSGQANIYEEYCKRRIRAKEMKYARILKKGGFLEKATADNK